MDLILGFLQSAPPVLAYSVLGVGAALENIIPLVPADTFVLLGGFLAARGWGSVGTVFLVTWTANVVSALLVYSAGYRYGGAFFGTRLGRFVLDPGQLDTVRRFYRRWGSAAIFYTRFLPGLRAVAPVFAGLTHQRPLSVAPPLMAASAIWYGAIVWLGAFAGRNLDSIVALQSRVNLTLLGIAVILSGLVLLWWIRSRHSGSRDEPRDPGSDPDSDPVGR